MDWMIAFCCQAIHVQTQDLWRANVDAEFAAFAIHFINFYPTFDWHRQLS
jgi:hypothetical protein